MYLLALVWCTLGGHSSWERSTQLRTVDSSTSISTLKKRYFFVTVHEKQRVWPDGTIRYCFESPQTKEKVLYTLERARDLWYQEGLPEAQFKLIEVSDAECNNNRANVLLIKFNDQGRLSTTQGIPAVNANDPTDEGPTMNLGDRTDVGMLDVVANYAHELGHAWGLLHEHQNPAFWTSPYSSSGFGGGFHFDCRNLKDYAEVAGRLSSDDMDSACKFQKFAAAAKFSASEYLPILGADGTGEGVLAEPDLKSLMIYPSGAGAVGPASPGNDGRADILLTSDGNKILPNLKPTTRDIQGLLKLYETAGDNTHPTLLNQPESSKSNKFKDLFKKKRCL